MATKPTRTHIEVSVQEQLLILRSYKVNKCNWAAICNDVKKEADVLPEKAKTFYQDGPFEKLKRRMSDQVSKLKLKDPNLIRNEELRALVEGVAGDERRYSTKSHPSEKRPKPKEVNNTTTVEPEVLPVVNRPRETVTTEEVEEIPVMEDHRRKAIPVEEDDEQPVMGQRKRKADVIEEPTEAVEPDTPKKKSAVELARQAYEQYIQSQESAKKLEEKMSKCMDKFLSM